jgi:hypothetical protein
MQAIIYTVDHNTDPRLAIGVHIPNSAGATSELPTKQLIGTWKSRKQSRHVYYVVFVWQTLHLHTAHFAIESSRSSDLDFDTNPSGQNQKHRCCVWVGE